MSMHCKGAYVYAVARRALHCKSNTISGAGVSRVWRRRLSTNDDRISNLLQQGKLLLGDPLLHPTALTMDQKVDLLPEMANVAKLTAIVIKFPSLSDPANPQTRCGSAIFLW